MSGEAIEIPDFGNSANTANTANEIAASEEWEAPVPLDRDRGADFPVDDLPPWMADHVRAVAAHTQTDPAMAAMIALAALSAAAGGSVSIDCGWREPVTALWVLVVAPSASRKSAVFTEMTAPLAELEKRLIEETFGEIADLARRKRIEEQAAEAAENEASKCERIEDREEASKAARVAAERAEAISVPATPRLLVDDITPEALAIRLTSQGRAALFSDEGGVFEMAAGRYSKTANLDVYLKGQAGSSLRVD